MGRFNNKTVLIGGGLGKLRKDKLKMGLSAKIAKMMVKEGAHVILVDIDDEVAKKCAQEIGGSIEAMPCDLMKDRDFKTEEYTDDRGRKKTNVIWTDNPALEVVEKIVHEHGKLDILITNFDELIKGRVDNLEEKDYIKLREQNITPVFHLLAAVREQMSKQKKEQNIFSKVVMITNMVGKAGMSIASLYAAFKGSIIALTKNMAREFGRFANVNAVACGPFKERKMQGPKERMKTQYVTTASDRSNQHITFDKVAPVVCFLASDDAVGISGQSISVDGGLWLKLEQ